MAWRGLRRVDRTLLFLEWVDMGLFVWLCSILIDFWWGCGSVCVRVALR